MDKGFFYNISFPEGRCEVVTTDKNNAATCNDLMQILRHNKTHGLVTQYRSVTSLNCPPKYHDAGFLFSAIIKSIMLPRRLLMFFPRIKKTSIFTCGKAVKVRHRQECDQVRLPIWRIKITILVFKKTKKNTLLKIEAIWHFSCLSPIPSIWPS